MTTGLKENGVVMQRGNKQKEMILRQLRQRGCRITRQRMLLLDIILEENCSSCKEIYYKASRLDSSIGSATVYRMINMLEEIGVISRRNMYKIDCGEQEASDRVCTIEFEDDSSIELSSKAWNQIVQAGLAVCGYGKGQSIRSITAVSAE